MLNASRTEKGSPAVAPKKHSGRGGALRKHIPVRTCVACRQTGNKRGLVRVVRTPAGGVQVDTTGKLAGRGAYLCRSRVCWEQALRGARLGQALRKTLTADETAALRAFAATLPELTTGTQTPAGEAPSSDRE